MKKGKKKIILLLLAATLFILCIYSYLYYMNIKVSNIYANDFRHDLLQAKSQEKTFDMKDITQFEWDKMIVFYPYTSREEMEKVIGREWTGYSYFGYLFIQKTILGEYPLDDDSLNKLVFMKGEKVVLDITFQRGELDLTQIKGTIHREESKFMIQNNIVKPFN